MITLNQAKKALQAAEKKAESTGIAISTVIVDDHGSIIATSRMDGALPISPRIAQAKAWTSAALAVPSEGLAQFAKEGMPYFGINTLFGGELTPMAGGMPILQGKNLIGAVGVGGSPDISQDVECAKAASSQLSSTDKE